MREREIYLRRGTIVSCTAEQRDGDCMVVLTGTSVLTCIISGRRGVGKVSIGDVLCTELYH